MIAEKAEIHLILIPVFNLEIGRELDGEIRIGDVVFVSTTKIPRIRKRLGFIKTISDINSKIPKETNLFKRANTYAILKWNFANGQSVEKPISKIKEAIWILASSQTPSRTNIRYFGLPEHDKHLVNEHFVYSTKTGYFGLQSYRPSPIEPYRLEKEWKMIMKNHFFLAALNIINDKTRVNKKWANDIRNTLIAVGKSQFSTDLSQAFIYNMIGIETLLTRRGEKITIELKNRLNALFSWYFKRRQWTNWDNKIKEIYDLRCKAVHDGEISNIKIEDLIFTDLIIQNLLLNICNSTKHIKMKQDLIDFTKKYQARELLNLPQKYPFKIIFRSHWPNQKQIDKIKERMSWT